MVYNSRQEELEQIVKQALTENPYLKSALELFQMGQDQYARALSSIHSVVLTAGDKSNPQKDEHASLG